MLSLMNCTRSLGGFSILQKRSAKFAGTLTTDWPRSASWYSTVQWRGSLQSVAYKKYHVNFRLKTCHCASASALTYFFSTSMPDSHGDVSPGAFRPTFLRIVNASTKYSTISSGGAPV